VTQRPRVLFVSRERFRLPLAGSQKRKWDAVASVVEPRVLAAAPGGCPTGDERFHLVPPATPRMLDGVLHYLLLPWRIARELRSFRPDAAFVQGVHETVAFLVARRLTGAATKLVLDVQGDWHEATRSYGSPLRRILNPLNDALGPVAVRHADEIRAISTHTAQLVRAHGREPGATFAPYVDAEAFAARPPAPLPDQPRAVYVGVLEAVKAFDSLAAAWPAVARRVPGATLHVVGDGTLRALARSLVHEWPGRVEWDERLTSEEVAAAMDRAWVVCLPSRSEGLGRVAVEAAYRGRAVLGSNRGGIPDVVREGVNGLLVEPDDVDALANALASLLGDVRTANRLGEGARIVAEDLDVTADAYAANVKAIVERALAR
jgi:glycosyltransferase involved in cell wall biosynthesis